MQPKYQVSSRPINLIIHCEDDEIPLVVYRGTSEQAILDNIRDLTNLYRFRCLNEQKQPIILSSNLPNKTHIYIQNPNKKEEEPSDEPTFEEQVYTKYISIIIIIICIHIYILHYISST